MHMPLSVRKLLLLLPLLVRADAQSKTTPEELFRTVEALDGALFDSYNRCDLAKFGTFFVDDVEFYHDQGGVTLGRQKLTESVKENICGKVRRGLGRGWDAVYPAGGGGAGGGGGGRRSLAEGGGGGGVGEGIHLWRGQEGGGGGV